MNGKKKLIKKMIFEPKIPTQNNIKEVKKDEIPVLTTTEFVKGKLPPIQLQSTHILYKYNPDDNLILNIPYEIHKVDFLVFEDNTCGIRVEGKILELDAVQVNSDTVIEHGDGQCYRVCSVNYYLVPRQVTTQI